MRGKLVPIGSCTKEEGLFIEIFGTGSLDVYECWTESRVASGHLVFRIDVCRRSPVSAATCLLITLLRRVKRAAFLLSCRVG